MKPVRLSERVSEVASAEGGGAMAPSTIAGATCGRPARFYPISQVALAVGVLLAFGNATALWTFAQEPSASAIESSPARPGSSGEAPVPSSASGSVPAATPEAAAKPTTSADENATGTPAARAGASPATASGRKTLAKEKPKSASAASQAKGAQSAESSPFAGLGLSGNHGPVDVRSDTLSLDYKHSSVVFRGHVHAVQAGTELSSDILQINYGKDFHEIKEMVADRNVRISQGGRWATGDHAVLDQDKNTVVLTGSPVVHEGSDQITGKRITVFLDTGQSEVEGARAVIFPHQAQNRDNEATADHAR